MVRYHPLGVSSGAAGVRQGYRVVLILGPREDKVGITRSGEQNGILYYRRRTCSSLSGASGVHSQQGLLEV